MEEKPRGAGMTHDSIQGRVALVTGASRGIGRAIAVELARAGLDVIVNYRSRAEEAEAAVQEVEVAGRRAIAVQADVSKPGEVARLAEEARRFGQVSVLVNNAGISRPQPWSEITVQDFEAILTVNLTSAFMVTQAFLPAMVEAGWGRIISISSVAAQLGGVVGVHYAASKAGMIGMTHAYAAMLAKTGVTANAVAPALIATEMVTSNPNIRKEVIPIGRFGEPKEVAEAVLMLVRNGYMNGQTLSLNGGWYMT
jgi:3-oxoacyl-[acyl-carrier protein] reductase